MLHQDWVGSSGRKRKLSKKKSWLHRIIRPTDILNEKLQQWLLDWCIHQPISYQKKVQYYLTWIETDGSKRGWFQILVASWDKKLIESLIRLSYKTLTADKIRFTAAAPPLKLPLTLGTSLENITSANIKFSACIQNWDDHKIVEIKKIKFSYVYFNNTFTLKLQITSTQFSTK